MLSDSCRAKIISLSVSIIVIHLPLLSASVIGRDYDDNLLQMNIVLIR